MFSTDRKAVVVGGSNGIGLAICKALVQRGYYIEICDCVQPEEGVLASDSYKGVEIVYFPYTQSTSSTQLRNAISSGRE